MALSILYSVHSSKPLTKEQANEIIRVLDSNNGRKDTLDIVRFTPAPLDVIGFANWEMTGTTELPSNLDQAWSDIQYNVAILSLCRRLLPDANWSVDVDGHEIKWFNDQNQYDPSV